MKTSLSNIAMITVAAALSSIACEPAKQPLVPDACEGKSPEACGMVTLTVVRSGSGTGTVVSSPVGIDCGPSCSIEVVAGATVQLTATPGESSEFVRWKGACSGVNSCQVVVTESMTVEAVFGESTQTHVLDVAKTGEGVGSVRSSPAGIDCGSACSAGFESGATVALTATPGDGSSFAGWSGACNGTGTCTVTMSAARSVSASFAPATPTAYPLSVSRSGTGSGTVTSTPSGINCGSSCSVQMPAGAVVTLTATPAANATFTGWSGACSGTETCSVTMNGARSVVAGFAAQSSGTLDPFGSSGNGCVWLDPDTSSHSIGVAPEKVIVLPSGGVRISGLYVTPNFGPWPIFDPWFAAYSSSGMPEFIYDTHPQIYLIGYGSTADQLGVTSAGTLVFLVNGAVFRLTTSLVGPVDVLPKDMVALTGATGDGLVAANDQRLYRFTGVAEESGGSLDTAFGSQGSVKIELPAKARDAGINGDFAPAHVLVDANGRVYLVGTAMEGSVRRLLVMRYDAEGSLDTSFEQGVAIFSDAMTTDEVDAAFDAAKSRLVIGAVTEQGIVAYRIQASGIDSAFGSGGRAVVMAECWDPRLAVLADGRTMVAGSCIGDPEVRRLLANGQPDTGYNSTGARTFPLSFFTPEAVFVRVRSLAVTSTGATFVLLGADLLENPRGALCKLKP